LGNCFAEQGGSLEQDVQMLPRIKPAFRIDLEAIRASAEWNKHGVVGNLASEPLRGDRRRAYELYILRGGTF
jgi:hypothetical protein